MIRSVVYVHIGQAFPEYLLDSIYQTLLVCRSSPIYVLVDTSIVTDLSERVRSLATPSAFVHVVGTRCQSARAFANCIKQKFPSIAQFRDEFWIATTARFFVINEFMRTHCVQNVVHIESDNMLYTDVNSLEFNETKLNVVKDSPARVVPSIMYIPNADCISGLCDFIMDRAGSLDHFVNDMGSIANYGVFHELALFPGGSVMYDGAAIGQYLGGVDPRNGARPRRFVNETCVMKCDHYKFTTVNTNVGSKYVCVGAGRVTDIVNLHIHCKELFKFSSVFNIRESDIITGERFMAHCDIVFTTPEKVAFHKSLLLDCKTLLLSVDTLGDPARTQTNINRVLAARSGVVKVFLYGDFVTYFTSHILHGLHSACAIDYYVHNSDAVFDSVHLCDHEMTRMVFAQNPGIVHDKLTLLPIGLANRMWPHGDTKTLYAVMRDVYKYRKRRSLYINLNTATYPYRKALLDRITVEYSSSKSFKEYLYELADHKYSLCVRGNGMDTHRFWESLYLGVIPIVINNGDTGLQNFVINLHKIGIKFINVTSTTDDIIAKINSHEWEREWCGGLCNRKLFFSALKHKQYVVKD